MKKNQINYKIKSMMMNIWRNKMKIQKKNQMLIKVWRKMIQKMKKMFLKRIKKVKRTGKKVQNQKIIQKMKKKEKSKTKKIKKDEINIHVDNSNNDHSDNGSIKSRNESEDFENDWF